MTDATKQTVAAEPRPLRFWITLAFLSAGIFVYVLLVTRPTPHQPGTQGPAIGRRLPYLQLEGLTGESADVALDELSGRVTLINYWGTWCPPCLREFPDIAALGDQFVADDDFRLYAVSCGEYGNEDPQTLRDATEGFLRARHSELPTYVDRQGASRQAMIAALGLSGMEYPTTLVLDRDGTIRGFWRGFDRRFAEEMAELVERLLHEPPTVEADEDASVAAGARQGIE